MANSTSQPKPEEDKSKQTEPPKQEGKEKESTKDTVAVSKEEFEKLKSEIEGHKGTIRSYEEKLEKLDKIEAGLKNLVSDEHEDEDPIEALRKEITELKQKSAEGEAIKRKEDTLAQLDVSAGKKAYLRKIISGKEENLDEAIQKASEEYDRFSELDKKPGSDSRPSSAKPIGSAYGPNASVQDILKAGDPLRR